MKTSGNIEILTSDLENKKIGDLLGENDQNLMTVAQQVYASM